MSIDPGPRRLTFIGTGLQPTGYDKCSVRIVIIYTHRRLSWTRWRWGCNGRPSIDRNIVTTASRRHHAGEHFIRNLLTMSALLEHVLDHQEAKAGETLLEILEAHYKKQLIDISVQSHVQLY